MLPLTTTTLSLAAALLSSTTGVLASASASPKPPIKVPISAISPAAQHERRSPSPIEVTPRGNGNGNGNGGFIRAPIHAAPGHSTPQTKNTKLRRRQEDEGLKNQNLGTTYTIDIEIGTPPQTVTLILDTGSPDLWVNPQCETSGQEAYCSKFAQFDYTRSKTIEDTGAADILSYGKGNVTIEYVTDDVTIGSAKIKSQILGIGFESYDIPLGILGLSPAVNPDGQQPYPYLLDSMASQGVISSRAFSLDLRSIDNPSGAIIFGGVDLGKFSGALEKLPMLDPADTPSGADRYWIVLSGVGMTYPDGQVDESDEIAVPVFLDSGGTLSRLPPTIFQAIGDSFPGSQYDPESGFYIVDCKVAEEEAGSVDFIFGRNKKIRVPYADFIWEVQSGVCVVGVLPTDEEPVFGDSFLRAAYVVYDQDNRNLHLAQAANCGEQIVEIGSGANAVPSSTGKCKDESGPTKTAGGGGGLDVTATRAPTRTAAGGGPQVTNSDFGPGPAGTRVSTSGIGLPTGTGGGGGGGGGGGSGGGNGSGDGNDSKASGLDVGVTVAVALAGLNMLVVWLI
ncbi:aspartic peptidase domain-containing protein [Copromyces sp. CBS 386.78]|nr:aspartic peptidase domain-containing protein [Copromyces sp. CBS 386.78]